MNDRPTGPLAPTPSSYLPARAPWSPPPAGAALEADTALVPGWEYAAYWRRAAALVLDTVFLPLSLAPGYLLAVLLMGIGEGLLGLDSEPFAVVVAVTMAAGMLGGLFLYLRSFVYYQATRGQSWGKQILGIHVLMAHTQEPIGVGALLVRLLVIRLLSVITLGLLGLLDVLWPLWDSRRQALHDKLVVSVVVRREVRAGHPHHSAGSHSPDC